MDNVTEKIDIYLDFNAIISLAKEHTQDKDPLQNDLRALRNIWKAYQEGKTRLVTCGEDTEMDIIMWLNNHGCCVTDVLTPLEAIEEFARWDRSDNDLIRYWRRIFFYYEQIEPLPKVFEDTEPLFEDLLSIFSSNHHISETPNTLVNSCYSEDDTRKILIECAGLFADIFPEEDWQDLRHTDYSINWSALELALKNLNIYPAITGNEGEKNRRLFGLLNRFINLSKKSCKKPPMAEGHRDFIIDMVMKKYYKSQTNRAIRHILHCISHRIGLFVTTDQRLIGAFKRAKDFFKEYPELSTERLELVLPSEMESRIRI